MADNTGKKKSNDIVVKRCQYCGLVMFRGTNKQAKRKKIYCVECSLGPVFSS